MTIEVRRQPRESSQSLVYRFLHRVQRSGILVRARGNKFRQRSKSRQMEKKAALRREELRKKYEKIKRLGI